MNSLKKILNNARKELMKKEEARENILNRTRKATSLSKQAILMVHQKRLKEAKQLLKKACEITIELKGITAIHPEMSGVGMLSAAYQEYSEAKIFLNLVEKSVFITPKEIDVPTVDYTLGLADVIGEYRRLALDALREGSTGRAEECLETMDQIYVELMAMDEAYMLVPGLRRKSDVARRVIEATRGDVTQEIRRASLEKHLKKFEKYLKKPESNNA
jgi:translin